MSRKVIATCAVTGGSAAILDKHPDIPKTPAQIASSAIEAAKAGAAIVHIHVRNPETGLPSNKLELYEQVVKRIRDSSTDVIISRTCGMDGTIGLKSLDPRSLSDCSIKSSRDRCLHAITLKPEMATLDCGVVAFGENIFVAAHVRLA